MALVVPDVGEVELLRKMLRLDEDLTLRLYTVVTGGLSDTTVLGNFTEANFTGYTSKTLTKTSWPVPTTSGGVTSSTYSPVQTWTNSGASPQTILGYYVVGVTSGVLLWAEAFAFSETLNPGGTLNLTPKMELA